LRIPRQCLLLRRRPRLGAPVSVCAPHSCCWHPRPFPRLQLQGAHHRQRHAPVPPADRVLTFLLDTPSAATPRPRVPGQEAFEPPASCCITWCADRNRSRRTLSPAAAPPGTPITAPGLYLGSRLVLCALPMSFGFGFGRCNRPHGGCTTFCSVQRATQEPCGLRQRLLKSLLSRGARRRVAVKQALVATASRRRF